MVDREIVNREISVIRVVFEFYPIKGGSVTHILELSKQINPYLKSQVIIAPDFGGECENFDRSFPIPVIRVRYPKFDLLKLLKIPALPLQLWSYADNVINVIKEKDLLLSREKTVVCVHGTLLGAIISLKLKIEELRVPVVVYQDSANLFRISKRDALAAYLALAMFSLAKPTLLVIINDGGEISETYKIYKKFGINFEIVNHAIDTDFYRPRLNCRSGKYHEEFIVLSTARLDPFKRVDLGILAFKKFLEMTNYPNNAKLIIVGDGIEKRKLEELTKKEGMQKWVEFHGEKDPNEILNYLNLADVVIGTSLKSNLNRSILEAMAVGKPVVVFDSGRIGNLIRQMENGILVRSGDTHEFAERLKELYFNSELCKNIGLNARKTIIEERSWTTRIKEELEIYKKIFSGKTSAT